VATSAKLGVLLVGTLVVMIIGVVYAAARLLGAALPLRIVISKTILVAEGPLGADLSVAKQKENWEGNMKKLSALAHKILIAAAAIVVLISMLFVVWVTGLHSIVLDWLASLGQAGFGFTGVAAYLALSLAVVVVGWFFHARHLRRQLVPVDYARQEAYNAGYQAGYKRILHWWETVQKPAWEADRRELAHLRRIKETLYPWAMALHGKLTHLSKKGKHAGVFDNGDLHVPEAPADVQMILEPAVAKGIILAMHVLGVDCTWLGEATGMSPDQVRWIIDQLVAEGFLGKYDGATGQWPVIQKTPI
jgi:hypothetical protein